MSKEKARSPEVQQNRLFPRGSQSESTGDMAHTPWGGGGLMRAEPSGACSAHRLGLRGLRGVSAGVGAAALPCGCKMEPEVCLWPPSLFGQVVLGSGNRRAAKWEACFCRKRGDASQRGTLLRGGANVVETRPPPGRVAQRWGAVAWRAGL